MGIPGWLRRRLGKTRRRGAGSDASACDTSEDDDLRASLREQARVLVASGFRARAEILEHLCEWAEDEEAHVSASDIREMLDEYGDEEGTPETYTVDGEYVVVRPVPAQGYSYDVRAMFQRTPSTYTASDEPMIMAQAPYAVIYRACEIASVWNIDDNATVKFSTLAQRAIDRYAMRATMVNDSARNMEDFNG